MPRNKIIPRWSETAGKAPQPADLETHEIAINNADGKIYTKNANGDVILLASLYGDPNIKIKVDTATQSDEAVSLLQLLNFLTLQEGAYGYIKFPTNQGKDLIIQWMATDSNVKDNDYVAFPITFPNSTVAVLHTSNNGGAFCFSAYSITTAHCAVSKRDYDGNSNNQSSSILAIGY